MTHPLTPAELDQLRRNAKRQSRERNLSHTQALDEQAREKGFSNWSTLAKQVNRAAPAWPSDSSDSSSSQPFSAASSPASSPSLSPIASPTSRSATSAPFLGASRDELQLILHIVRRYESLLTEALPESDLPPRVPMMMDLEVCHCNGCPLDLAGLLQAPRDFDFMHDVAGIFRHLNRSTGELEGLFQPRYAARTSVQ